MACPTTTAQNRINAAALRFVQLYAADASGAELAAAKAEYDAAEAAFASLWEVAA